MPATTCTHQNELTLRRLSAKARRRAFGVSQATFARVSVKRACEPPPVIRANSSRTCHVTMDGTDGRDRRTGPTDGTDGRNRRSRRGCTPTWLALGAGGRSRAVQCCHVVVRVAVASGAGSSREFCKMVIAESREGPAKSRRASWRCRRMAPDCHPRHGRAQFLPRTAALRPYP
jgi:hypothetical protein